MSRIILNADFSALRLVRTSFHRRILGVGGWPPLFHSTKVSTDSDFSQVDRQRLMEKRTKMKQLRASISSGKKIGQTLSRIKRGNAPIKTL